MNAQAVPAAVRGVAKFAEKPSSISDGQKPARPCPCSWLPNPPLNPETTSPSVPSVVLDTNAVLDATVFANPDMLRLANAIATGQLRWLASAPMRLELQRVLDGRQLAQRLAQKPGERDAAVAWFDRWANPQEEPPPSLWPRLRCSDSDDQPFIDLALHCRARYLVSHDRALLKLAGKARVLGLQVLRPRDWLPT